MNRKYRELSENIILNVGGKENIDEITHCLTRLRFLLKDESKANMEILKNTEGIATIIKARGQFQVVIGIHVTDIFEEICKILDVQIKIKDSKDATVRANLITKDKKMNLACDLVEDQVIFSPMKGNIKELSEVKDQVFATGILGLGTAIEPIEGKVYAPCDGIVKTLFSTGHAIGILSEYGAEILIHVGMDTVQLKGRGFSKKVVVGDKIKRGQLLLEFDLEEVKKAGFSVISPMIITNTDDYLDVAVTDKKKVTVGDEIIMVLLDRRTKKEVL